MSSSSKNHHTKPGSYGIEYWKRDPSPPVSETMQYMHHRDVPTSKQVHKSKATSSISRSISRYQESSSSKKASKLKRQRPLGSEGSPSPSPGPLRSSSSEDPAERFRQLLEDHVMAHSPAAQDSDNLACPFVKHDPGRYAYVVNSCTETGFKDVGSLRDHIKRVHSRKYGCTECYSHRFNCGKKQLGQAKQKHQGQKECKESKKKLDERKDASEPEWMTEAQEREYETLDLRRVRLDNLKESFREIYTHLWPESKADVSTIPTHCYGPGFLVSTFVIDQILEQLHIGQTRRSLSSRLPSQQPPYEQDTAETEDDPSPQPPGENIDGILGANGFDYSVYVPDPAPTAFIASNNASSNNYPDNNSSMFDNPPDTYLPPGSFYSSQPVPTFGGGSSNNDHFIMSPAAAPDEPRVPPFSYIIPGSTGPSNQDSAYGTNLSDENEGYKPQQHHPSYHSHNAASFPLTNWDRAGPSGPEQNPPAGDDIHLDEEGVGDELGNFYCSNYFPAEGGRFDGVLHSTSR
ncbi:hypothetical protein PG984_010971 [Apiospora sp. TS-2023a]